ncbi:hypothetical protein HMPREF0072_1698 [Anaerococcus lactolyticus ATCC 51172]|uniref:Uncharacterized protein n=1 Tax=Anaerococcus lactolyticus ATCC 51172 TaxID=525254 RepID=C2BH78_9FIRM|nr:hypothetical protein HMPREF0072_1698 [Anaerococcus lactolyticus ATCC 51172]
MSITTNMTKNLNLILAEDLTNFNIESNNKLIVIMITIKGKCNPYPNIVADRKLYFLIIISPLPVRKVTHT